MRPSAPALALAAALAGCDPGPTIWAVPVEGAPQAGPADAWITLVEFADFQCGYCAKAVETVHRVEQAWPDDVRVVFRHLPLDGHDYAWPAARAAQCAFAQGKFWEMYDALYEDTSALYSHDLAARAERLGLDVETWRACLVDPATDAAIEADVALAKRFSVRGTPTFFVNGRRIGGAQPFESFQQVVDEELKKARESGIERARYYDTAVLGQR